MLGEPGTVQSRDLETPLFAEVIVPRHFAGPFTYLIPPPLQPLLRVGQLVFVPFGRSLVQGAVIALTRDHPPAVPLERLRPIRTLAPPGRVGEISPRLLELAKAVAEAYVAPWGQCLRLVLPPKATTAERYRIILTKEGQHALANREPAAAAAIQLLKRLRRRPLGISLSRLCEAENAAHQEALTSVLERGWAHKVAVRAPSLTPDLCLGQDHERAQGSEIAKDVLKWEPLLFRALEHRKTARLLLEADPAERLALLRAAAAKTVELGRKVLVVTGETARAESLAAALSERAMATVVLHGMMPEEKRAEVWDRIRLNQASVVVGTRAAMFLPLEPIGLIWIDREEDSALKEPMEPRYHAREVGWMRAQKEQALLVLTSAHLSLEATALERPEHWLKASPRPKLRPQVEIIDLRREDRRSLLSSRLQEAMHDAMDRQAGVLLFLNRKAYAGALLCRDCGQVPRCRSCAVAFAFSRQKNALFCHYCGATEAMCDVCPACASARLQPVGEGTERVEEEVKRRFPAARVLRVDGETMRRSKAAHGMWDSIRRREWDVLIGTQILLKDDVMAPVDLVGVVQADAGLSLPDFRAAERTFHLLKDAARLAEPMSAGGRLVIQTFLPSHHVIEAVARQDDEVFRHEELAHRTALGFPPAVRVIVLHISGAVESAVEQAAEAWAAALNQGANTKPGGEPLVILGPVCSPVPRVRGRYRRQILVKSRPDFHAAEAIRSTVTDLESLYARRKVKFDVDVDPIEMW
ncbi:MAG TPA: primosomal protein N' [Nitrospira sp.]|nr:primosomal protein N' [Nitrospira sp.]